MKLSNQFTFLRFFIKKGQVIIKVDLIQNMKILDPLETINDIRLFSLRDKKEKCNLYAIDMFFVEVVYNPVKNKIVEFRSFKTGHLLDKYSNLRI